VDGSIECLNTVFGDPHYLQGKECQCEQAPTTEAPSNRLYDAKEAVLVQQAVTPKSENSMASAWALPLFGVVGMLSFAAFVGGRACSQRSTRQVSLSQPPLDEEALLSEFE